MSDLENFVNQSGRDKGVKDVRKKIKSGTWAPDGIEITLDPTKLSRKQVL